MLKHSPITILFVTCLALLLNACVAVIAAGAIAGKEVLKSSQSNEEGIKNLEAQPPSAPPLLVTQLDVVEMPLQKATEPKKEFIQSNPDNKKSITSTKSSIASNQLELLNASPWHVSSAPSINNPINFKDTAFIFATNGTFSGFGGCNYFLGKFKANNKGDFIISTLKSSNEICSKNNDEELKLINLLIMADRFEIRNNRLTLFSNQLNLLNLDQATEINADQLIKKTSNLKRKTKSAKHNSSRNLN